MNTAQITVRNLDPQLKQAIKDKAHSAHQSINGWMLDAAREKAGLAKSPVKPAWRKLAGRIPMTDAELQERFQDFRRIDPKDWQ